MTTALPDWAESTVRVLRITGHSPHSSKRTSVDLLARAMTKYKYLYAEMVEKRKFSEARWKTSIEQLASEWTEKSHHKFMKWLEAGGYSAPAAEALVHPEKLLIPTSAGMEEIEMELDEEDLDAVEAAASITSGKKSQPSPKHEMQEILDAAEMQSDPRYGAW